MFDYYALSEENKFNAYQVIIHYYHCLFLEVLVPLAFPSLLFLGGLLLLPYTLTCSTGTRHIPVNKQYNEKCNN